MAALDRPRVEYRTPVDLVDEVRSGLLRIPPFQRGFRWEAGDVVKLFDSLVRGYPIGNLLLWRRPAPRQDVRVGALEISAPETDSALWVVDGQQRITSLVSALAMAETATDARFRVHLDLESGNFHTSGVRQLAPASWLPVNVLLDTSTLLRWMRDNAAWLSEIQIHVADQAAKAIREYQIPTYVVTSSDEQSLVDIFARMNTTGKPLTKAEVFQALHSGMAGGAPGTLRELALVPAELGFGAFDDRLALRCVLAYRGGDVFRDDFHGEFASDDDRITTFEGVAAVIREAVGFLRSEVGIAHAKLLPYSHVVPTLARYIRNFGPPAGRSATLLRRWIWRGAVAGTRAKGISVPDIRNQVAALEVDDPLAAARALLSLVQSFPDFAPELDKVNFSHAMTKLNVLGLLAANPQRLPGGGPLDLPALLEHGSPLRTIVNESIALSDTIANRLISPSGSGRTLQDGLAGASPEVARSHVVSDEAGHALRNGVLPLFLVRREAELQRFISDHIGRMAEWGARDGQSMSDLLRVA